MADTAADAMSETNSVSSFRPRFIGRLSLTKSDGTVRFFNIKRSILIGRGSECDIRIKVKTVSRVHCKVRVQIPDAASSSPSKPLGLASAAAAAAAAAAPAQFVLENVSTTNFTIVNSEEVSGQVSLRDGDVITVAERGFVFQLIDSEAAAGAGDAGDIAGAALGHIALGHESASQLPPPEPESSMGIYSIFCGSPSPSTATAAHPSAQQGRRDGSQQEGESSGGCSVM